MLTLDVGCGDNPKGDVNCDIYREVNPQVLGVKSVAVNPKRISNFVLASGLCLPFRSDCFDEVYSRGVIEHVDEPQRFLSELIRVSKRIVRVLAPHRYGSKSRGTFHQAFLNVQWFSKVLKDYGHEIDCTYRRFPLFFLPDWISVSIYKFSGSG